MSAQDNDLFSAFAEATPPAQTDTDDETLETLTYIAFLLEDIASALETSASGAVAVGPKQGSSEALSTEARATTPRNTAVSAQKENAVKGDSPEAPRRDPIQELRSASHEQPPAAKDTQHTRKTHTVASTGTPQAKQQSQTPALTATALPQASIIPLQSAAVARSRSSESIQSAQANNAGKSKSQVQLEEEQQKSAEQKQSGLLDALKHNLSDWDGTTNGTHEEDLQEAAGIAADGPLFAAVKDIARLVETDEDDKSLLGVLRKTVEDKTGITAAKNWATQKKENLIDTIHGWGSGKQEPAAQPAPVPTGNVQRDAQGRFIPKKSGKTKPLPPLPTDEEKEQLEFTETLVAIQVKEAKLNEQRHEDIMQALRQDSGGGLLDKAKGAVDWIREKRRERADNASRDRGDGRQGGRRSRAGNRSQRRGGFLSRTRIGSWFGAAEDSSPSARWGRGNRGATGLSHMGSGLLGRGMNLGAQGIALGAKGLLGAAKMLPVVGQVLAGGAALMDGFQGWNDAEGQQVAFDLKPGEEATTGQKASYAVASALDMGGLVTGLAQELGFDLDTGDIAKGLYSAVEFAGSVAKTIASSASGIVGTLTDGFLNLTNSIGDKAGKLWTSASSSIGSAMSAVAGAAQGLLDSATATVSETVSAISAKGAELWNSATSALSGAASAVGSTVASAWASTTEAASSVVAATKEKTTSLLDSSLAWFGFGDSGKDAETDKTSAVTHASASTAHTATSLTTPPGTPAEAETRKSSPVAAVVNGARAASVGPEPGERNTLPPANAPEPAVFTASPTVNASPQKQPVATSLLMANSAKTQSHTTTARIGGSNPVQSIVSEPGEAMTGLFTGLTQSIDALKKTLESSVMGENNESIVPSVQGMLAGMNSWFKGQFKGQFSSAGSTGAGGSSGHSGGGGNRSTGTAVAARYVHDPNAQIGEAIAKYESGTSGSSAIGYDTTGGTSYGKYQLASKAGSMEGFLKMMEGKGGEHAAIAARLRASGPANTGSRQGDMPEQWKKEAATNGELLKSAEHEYMLKANYAPAMNALNGDLRTRVEGNKALQEAMFSTAVQHGPGRTAGIWNKVYKDSMSEEDLIRAVYNERATRFGSSTPQVQEAAKRRMASEQEVILSMHRAESSTQPVVAAVQNSPQDQAIQAAASASIQESTQAAINRGVAYDFGAKNSQSGGIDCSGWVTEINRNLMASVNTAMGQDVYSTEAKQVLKQGANGGAAGIIQSVSGATGELLRNGDLSPDKIREGMMIGMDTGNRGWDAGRFNGIDHIVQTYKDKLTGKMMVSESRSGKGVINTDYEEWYKKNSRHALYGADVTRLADASKLQPQAETALAAAATPEAVPSDSGTATTTESAVATVAPEVTSSSPTTESAVAAVAPAVPLAQPPMQAQALVASGQVAPLVSAPAYVQATVSESRRVREPEILREPASPPSTLNFGAIENLLAQLIDVVREQKSPADSQERKDQFPDIRVEYDDPYLVQMAHDRA